MITRKPASPAVVALLCGLTALAWQLATVHRNYHGNWSALYHTGATAPSPPGPEFAGTWIHPGNGYDGQYYRYLAHDLLLRRGFASFVDAPRLRARRVLVPALAFVGGFGRPELIDTAYFAVILGFVCLGSYWTARFAVNCGRAALWGLGFLLVPCVPISLDRMTVDVSLAALCCGWALQSVCAGGPRYGLLSVIPLARETGLLLNGATVICLASQRRFREAAVAGTTAIPIALWAAYTAVATPAPQHQWFGGWPTEGVVRRILAAPVYPVDLPLRGLVVALDWVALLAVSAAIVLALNLWVRNRSGALETAALFFALLAIGVSRPDVWNDAFGYSRVLSTLLLILSLQALKTRRVLYALPMLAVTLRTGVQLAPQVLGILNVPAH